MRDLIRFAGSLVAVAIVPAAAFAQAREIVRADGKPGMHFGISAVVVGDVDGDGRADLLVGAEYDVLGLLGSATICSGMDGHELRRHDGEKSRSWFGYAVEKLADVNGDGIFDYVVSAPGYFDSVSGKETGKLYVYSGSDGASIWTLVGFGDKRDWGSQLVCVGDADGDGASDFAVNKAYGGVVQGGRVEMLSGATGASIWHVDAPVGGERFSFDLARVPDVDGDGVDEVAATAPWYSGPDGAGRVFLFSGANGREFWHASYALGPSFAEAVADGGDVDGDGVHDVAVGAPYDGSAYNGAIHLLSGVDGSLLGKIYGDDNAMLGFVISDALDADGDGDPDLASPRADPQFIEHLSLYDVRSQSFLADVRTTGGGAADFAALAPAGDLDGDGFADLLVGMPGGAGTGEVFVYAMRSKPALSSVTPSRGDHHFDTNVTLSGSGFLLAKSLQVSFGVNAATNVTIVDDATITCTAPAGAAGLDDVAVSDDAGSATLAGGFAATPALRIDGDPVVGGTLTLSFLCNPGDDLFVVAGLPPIVTIPTPPYEGALRIFPFLPVVYLPGWSSDEFDLVGSIPNDPTLSGQHFLVQALVGAPLTGAGKNGSWTNCGDVSIQ